jgi:hypothetical protein
MLRSSKWSLPVKLSNQILYAFLISPMHARIHVCVCVCVTTILHYNIKF